MSTRLQRLRRESVAEAFPLAGPAFRRAAPWLLAGVLLVGLLTRLHPTVRYAVWGSDSGEYILLARQLVETGRVLFDYDGWGIAYPYFPGMFVVSGAVSEVVGLDVQRAVLWVTPVLAGTLGVLVGLLAYRVTNDPRAGVLAGAFVAVCSVVVITTSHAMPGTLGQVLLLAMLVLLPDAYRDRAHLVLLALLGAALVLTHHLTTYFAVGTLAMIPFYREMAQRHTDWRRLRAEAPLVVGLTLAATFWWLQVAKPFREQIVGDALDVSPWLTAFLFLAALAALPALVVLKRTRSDWHHAPSYPNFVRQRRYILGGFFGFTLVLLFVSFVKVPGTDIRVHPIALAYAVPVLAVLAFLPLGHAVVRFHRHGSVVLGYLYAVLASLAFASLTSSRVLFPFRHVDYMVEGMATLAALGLLMVYDQTLASRVSAERPRTRAQLLAVLTVILLAGAVLSLPPREVIGGFEEGMTRSELTAVEWVRDHPEVIAPNSTFAADHRVSSLLWGLAGMHATWDYTPRTYHAENATEVIDELADAHVPARGPARVDYVFLSRPIEEGVTMLQWEQSAPMTRAAIMKFEDPGLFEKLYEEDDVRIYRVRWEAVAR